MDERLERALDRAKFKHTQVLEKRRLQEKLKAELTLPYGGSRFYINRGFISFLNCITPDEGTASVVLIDDNGVPVRVEDIVKFRDDVINLYTNVTNQYFIDYEQYRRKRSIEGVVDL